MLIFEHVDQDLAQYLEKNTSGLSPECIQVCNNSVNKLHFQFLANVNSGSRSLYAVACLSVTLVHPTLFRTLDIR